jgi:hypothetical protein
MTAAQRSTKVPRPPVGTLSAPPPTPGLPPRPPAPSIEDILTRLTLLAPLAAGNRGPVPLGDPRRVAAAEYTWLLAAARDNCVPITALVEATNSPWRTLKARLRRHQMIPPPPSIKPYQNRQYVRPPIDHCVHRHPYTDENTYVHTDPVTGQQRRKCKQCRAKNQARRRRRAAAENTKTASPDGKAASGTTSRLLVPTD